MRKWRVLLAIVMLTFVAACGNEQAVEFSDSFEKAATTAEGSTVNLYMWGGDEGINSYIDDYVAPRLEESYNIELNRVAMDTAEFIRQLSLDNKADRQVGTIDAVWINGDNFRNAKEAGLLRDGLIERVPNAELLNETAQQSDAGTPTEDLELAWGNVQFILHYDAAKVDNPPQSFEELRRWTEDNPGRFTYPEVTDFTGNAFVRHLLYERYGDELDQKATIEDSFWDDLKAWSPNLWKDGQTYPKTLEQLDQLYASGEVWMTMGFNERRAEAEVTEGIFPKETRALVLDHSIASTHFLAVPFNAPNPDGALVLLQELLSPEAQLVKQGPDYWGDGTSLDLTKLDVNDQRAFEELGEGVTYPDSEQLLERSIPDYGPNVIDIVREEWPRVAK
ncbi:ABC transporter substrate-binding protein [Exiguobacterium profundum]|uniref:ABC transporter substrate-binding protein n=1 Tax=Exiguobacterium profundum TaxID=307643 RepID=UPI0029C13545|nr:ABC transporter substrate-binding protein [Exiguobacterium profundum]MDX5979847.1 ABC transporter substrate-binding protein [Exiguobacterium profundum]